MHTHLDPLIENRVLEKKRDIKIIYIFFVRDPGKNSGAKNQLFLDLDQVNDISYLEILE